MADKFLLATTGVQSTMVSTWEYELYCSILKDGSLSLRGSKDGMDEYGGRLKRAYTYKAMNRLIQGSAADMTKQAMLDLYKEGLLAHTQVHDELNISVTDKKECEKVVDIMRDCVELKVPNKVDAEIGPSWGDVTDYKEYFNEES